MSQDSTVLCADQPDRDLILRCLLATMPEHYVREAAGGMVLELLQYDDGDVQLAVELPRLVRVPSEIGRLLPGATISTVPDTILPAVLAGGTATATGADDMVSSLWWLELHVLRSSDAPTSEKSAGSQPDMLVEELAHAIAGNCAGAVLPPVQALAGSNRP
ncbi:hypothetical protein IV500_03010 [Paeniglutamicibacter antarcticus]|uniref:Uncharacterized protein n=1 Tax=Arthrobacter terrae TaxID=2935737 RepID=A0A931G4G9_9MICC|nr:hypothetical protein [Arthrobacter terrae]MBG0738400.1 hypothetical protein [Arthrobacter terrae]